ncbi:MAG: hypothetical protein WC322_06530 [Candidatus Paceibacterota bacterium]|jgi:hypothetical protein
MGYPVDFVSITVVYRDGSREILPPETWAEVYAPSREEAEEFVYKRIRDVEEAEASGISNSILRLNGLFLADYDDPVETQIQDYMRPVFRWPG